MHFVPLHIPYNVLPLVNGKSGIHHIKINVACEIRGIRCIDFPVLRLGFIRATLDKKRKCKLTNKRYRKNFSHDRLRVQIYSIFKIELRSIVSPQRADSDCEYY